MSNSLLFLISTVVWGSTWLVILFQLGSVPTSASVGYRFLLAGGLLMAWCALRGESLRLPRVQWPWVALQGVLLFGLSYIFVYESERHITSGLVAVLNSAMLVFNLVGMRLCFDMPIERRSVLGAVLGLSGIVLVFWPELAVRGSASHWLGIGFGLTSAIIASAGNMVAQRNRLVGLPLLPNMAWSMLTGGTTALLVTVLLGLPLTFDPRPAYLVSLFYLAVLGSILAFACYLTLLGRIGAGRAVYVAISTPMLALLVSSVFEGFRLQPLTLAGLLLAVMGNVVMLTERTTLDAWLTYIGLNRRRAA
jgi:drug/metabolite transporter (DMT)-like permease